MHLGLSLWFWYFVCNDKQTELAFDDKASFDKYSNQAVE